MISALNNIELLRLPLAGDAIGRPVFAGDPARSPTLQRMLEVFRHPKSLERIALDVLDQGADGFATFLVLIPLVEIVLPGVFASRGDHATSQPDLVCSIGSRSVNVPSSASLIARSGRAALAGLSRVHPCNCPCGSHRSGRQDAAGDRLANNLLPTQPAGTISGTIDRRLLQGSQA